MGFYIKLKNTWVKLLKILKILAIIYGINAASSNIPCVWCKFDKSKLKNVDIDKVQREIEREWFILSEEKGARTIDNAVRSINKFGQINTPIITSIPFHRIVVDMLHLFLRITDVLVDLFVINLKELDGYQQNKLNLDAQPHFNGFLVDLVEQYNIKSPFLIENKDIKVRDFQGPEKEKLFSDFDLKKYAKGNEKIKKINQLWLDFYSMYTQIKKKELKHLDVKTKTKDWLLAFAAIYDAKHITPNIHIFVNHVHEFIDKYSDVNQFNVEGLEKLNHMTHSQVFRATNNSADYLKQIMRKRNRMEVLCRNIS